MPRKDMKKSGIKVKKVKKPKGNSPYKGKGK